MSNRKVKTPAVPSAPEPVSFAGSEFLPSPPTPAEVEGISRPALTYWQDAMKRLRKDRMAMTCVAGITIIVMIGIVGPWFFPAETNGVPYHNQQNSNAIDQGPSRGESVLITDDTADYVEDKIAEGYDASAPFLEPAAIPPVEGLQISGVASVNSVKLEWQPLVGVAGYQIYRTVLLQGEQPDVEALAAGTIERGITLADITNPAQISFTDGLGLDASERYAYTVIGFVADPQTFQHVPGPRGAVIVTELKRTLKLSDAISLYPEAQVGQEVMGRAHPFGTDGLGRDVLARMIQGTRVDMLLALMVPTVAIFFGMLIGSISGLMGKKVDLILMRVVEVIDNFPDLLVFILLQVAFGKGLLSLFVALSLFSWAGFARIVRGEVLRLREIEFVQASRLLGAPVLRLVFRHIGPNLLGLVIIAWSARIPGVIATEAFLSMIGLGLEQPDPSWGSVVFDAARRLQVNPVQFFLPASMLGITLLCFYLLGNSLRDAFDPKLRGRG